jgi:hypothetical protein
VSHLSEMYESEQRQHQRMMDTWGDYNDKTEKLVAKMEKQIESDEYKELKR